MGRAQFYQMFPFAIDEMNEPLRNEEKENSKLPVPRKTLCSIIRLAFSPESLRIIYQKQVKTLQKENDSILLFLLLLLRLFFARIERDESAGGRKEKGERKKSEAARSNGAGAGGEREGAGGSIWK